MSTTYIDQLREDAEMTEEVARGMFEAYGEPYTEAEVQELHQAQVRALTATDYAQRREELLAEVDALDGPPSVDAEFAAQELLDVFALAANVGPSA